jgi:hypothetical protein
VNQRYDILKVVVPPLAAWSSTFILLMVSAGLISGLPRPTQGESVSLSWSVCVLGAIAFALFPPWFVSLPLLKERGLRLYFFLWLAVAAAVWYFTGFEELLSKAYRRGL